ncbi:hypothetical protein B0T10DRAFT_541398 [Thelonectria olida]|uniref:C2H2-type domain-containing protein n=1 Tax=Thelonectria olida TaxID=1576542 RepID=A0A9P9AJ39_9HYPO|nr:hypothetical protein B0T10DRAFT_541398 [Thelonectria olida]
MEQYAQINEQHRVLVCQLCPGGVRPGSAIDRHFRREHGLKGQILREINDYFAAMELNDPMYVTLPEDGSAAIQLLNVVRGYCCTMCRYPTIARDNITRHWRTAGHEATSRGQKQYVEVLLQSWMQGGHARYWIIGDADKAPAAKGASLAPGDMGSGGNEGSSAMERMIAEYEASFTEEDAERLRKGDVEEGIDRDSQWVKRLGWVRHFASRDKLDIFRAAECVEWRKTHKRPESSDCSSGWARASTAK